MLLDRAVASELTNLVLHDGGLTRLPGVYYALVPGFRPLQMDITVPAGRAPVPVVLYLHGGGFRVGHHRDWPRLVTTLTGNGFATATVQYRLSAEATFPAALHDVKAAVRFLRQHALELGIDAERIGAWGRSAGGYFAAMLATTAGDPELDGAEGLADGSTGIRAGVSWYGPADLATQPRHGPPSWHNTDPGRSPEALWLGAPVHTVPELAALASPLTHVSGTSAPLMLVHGDRDDGVPIDQSERLADAYRAAGATVELIRVPGGDHGLAGVDHAPLIAAGIAFLARHLA